MKVDSRVNIGGSAAADQRHTISFRAAGRLPGFQWMRKSPARAMRRSFCVPPTMPVRAFSGYNSGRAAAAVGAINPMMRTNP